MLALLLVTPKLDSLPKFARNFMSLGIHKTQETMVGININSIVHMACSEMLLRAMLMVMTADEHAKSWLSTKPRPTTVARGVPPIILKQSTQLNTEGYLLKNWSRTYAVYITVMPMKTCVSKVLAASDPW
jgi:hypothetical protein